MSPHITPDPLSPPRFPDEEFDQQPRHTVLVEWDGDDVLMTLECPFGNSTYVSNYPTVSDTWFDDDFGVDTSAWPPPWTGFIERLGQIEEGYCSIDWQGIRPLLRMKHYGCVIEMQPVASSGSAASSPR
jgi:hypothetical protein